MGPCVLIDNMYRCAGKRNFMCVRCELFTLRQRNRSSHPRSWHIAIGNCDSTIGMRVTYDLGMYNAQPDQWWTRQFNSNETSESARDVKSTLSVQEFSKPTSPSSYSNCCC